MNAHDEARAVAAQLRARFGAPPPTALILGSGLSRLTEALDPKEGRVPYGAVGLPDTGVAGHAGAVVVGSLSGARVAVLAGRVHTYEGHPQRRVVASVRAMAAWGVRRLVLTSAVGGLHPHLPSGALVRLVDHLNLSGQNPLTGEEPWPGRERFPDLTHAYSPTLGAALDAAAARLDIALVPGIYAAMPGPSYETPAEVRMLRLLGADVVGMSTVHEAIAGVACGLEVTGISVVANAAAGLSAVPLLHADVTREVDAAASRLTALLSAFVGDLPG
jgi:purine-nucleoside phosphorylase